MLDFLEDETKVAFHAAKLSLGYWYPADEDAYKLFQNREERLDFSGQWLEETSATVCPAVHIDLTRRAVELVFSAEKAISTMYPFDTLLPGGLDDLVSFISGLTPTEYVLSFRFKDLMRAIELARENSQTGNYSLFFSLRHPPKLFARFHSILDPNSTEAVKDERRVALPVIDDESFGRYLGYRIVLTESTVDTLLLNEKALQKLENFGILQNGMDAKELADQISCSKVARLQVPAVNDGKIGTHESPFVKFLNTILEVTSCILQLFSSAHCLTETDVVSFMQCVTELTSMEGL